MTTSSNSTQSVAVTEIMCNFAGSTANHHTMKKKITIAALILAIFVGLLGCKKENNDTPVTPDVPDNPGQPSVSYQIPPIDEYIPQRLIHLFDSIGVLHRGNQPPTISGNFMTESMNMLIINKVPESNYMGAPAPIPTPYYYEFKEQETDTLHVSFKMPKGTPDELGYFLEKSDTDSTYLRIKENTELFTNDPIAPPYFKSDKFKAEDFRRAYIMGSGDYFTVYFYDLRDISSRALPLNALLISGKMAADAEGNPVIEDFWVGTETMTYTDGGPAINQIIQLGFLPHPGDIHVLASTNSLTPGSFIE